MSTICFVPECTRQQHTSNFGGICLMHYKRLRRNGTTALQYVPTLAERFWAKVVKDGPIPSHRPDLGPCWTWTGTIHGATGYGYFSLDHSHPVGAHRIAYELTIGPLGNAIVDHLCRNRACPNPTHLEPVTYRENLVRGPTTIAAQNLAKTHCPHGHSYDEVNTYIWRDGSRHCRACSREKMQLRRSLP